MSPHDQRGAFIVQDEESGYFLTPAGGDVGFTSQIRKAGLFDGLAEACDTAELNCHEGYFVVQILTMNPRADVAQTHSRFWDEG